MFLNFFKGYMFNDFFSIKAFMFLLVHIKSNCSILMKLKELGLAVNSHIPVKKVKI